MAPIVQIIVTVAGGVILSIFTGCLAYFKGQARQYKALLEQKKDTSIRNTIQEEIQPIVEEIHRLQARLDNCENLETHHIGAILSSYKFRLIYLCRTYIRQGSMTSEQYEQLSEFYRVYHELGGNGQAEEYYHRASALPIVNNIEQ